MVETWKYLSAAYQTICQSNPPKRPARNVGQEQQQDGSAQPKLGDRRTIEDEDSEEEEEDDNDKVEVVEEDEEEEGNWNK